MKKILFLSMLFICFSFNAKSQHIGQILQANSMNSPSWAYNEQEISVRVEVYNTTTNWVYSHFYLVIDNVNSPWYISSWDDAPHLAFAPNQIKVVELKGRVFTADLLPPGGRYELQVRVNKNGSMAGKGEEILNYARAPFAIK